MHLDDKDLLKKSSARGRSKKTSFKPVGYLDTTQTEEAVAAVMPPISIPTPLPQKQQNPFLEKLQTAFDWTLYGLVFLMPLFFLPNTNEFLEINKQLLLFVGTVLLVILYGVKIYSSSTIEIKGSGVFIGYLLVLGAWLAASVLSHYPANSYLGFERQEFMSFGTLFMLGILGFVVINNSTNAQRLRAVYTLILSTALATLLGLLQLLGTFLLPFDFSRNIAFNTIGLVDLWGVVLVLTIPMAIALLVRLSRENGSHKTLLSAALAFFVCLALIMLVIFDDRWLWIGLMIGTALLLGLLYKKLPREQKVMWLMLPSLIIVISATMLVAHMPRFVRLPLAAQPSWTTSFTISWNTLLDSPLTGYGPGTFLESYGRFKPKEINNTSFLNLWAIRFDQSSSQLFTALAATGLAGIFALAIFAVFLFLAVASYIKKKELDDSLILSLGLAGALASFAFLAVVKPGNMVVVFIGGLYVMLLAANFARPLSRMNIEQSNKFLISSSLLLGIIGVATLLGGFALIQRYRGDTLFANALSLDKKLSAQLNEAQDISPTAVEELVQKMSDAVRVNPSDAGHLRTLSQALLFKLGLIARTASQDPAQVQQIQNVVSTAIDTARQATILNPHDSRNTQNLADAYHAVAPFVAGTDPIVDQYYAQSLQLEPNNPLIRLQYAKALIESAGIKIQLAQTAKADTEKSSLKDASAALRAQAKKQLTDAIALKGDYAAAHYYLGIIYAQENNKDDSVKELETATSQNAALLNTQSADETLFYLLGLSYISLGDSQKALDEFRLALAVRPDYADALWQYGLVLADTGKKDEAIQALTRLSQFAPKNETVQKKIQELNTTPSVAPVVNTKDATSTEPTPPEGAPKK